MLSDCYAGAMLLSQKLSRLDAFPKVVGIGSRSELVQLGAPVWDFASEPLCSSRVAWEGILPASTVLLVTPKCFPHPYHTRFEATLPTPPKDTRFLGMGSLGLSRRPGTVSALDLSRKTDRHW